MSRTLARGARIALGASPQRLHAWSWSSPATHARCLRTSFYLQMHFFLASEFGLDPGILTSVFFFFFCKFSLSVVGYRLLQQAESPDDSPIVLPLEDPKTPEPAGRCLGKHRVCFLIPYFNIRRIGLCHCCWKGPQPRSFWNISGIQSGTLGFDKGFSPFPGYFSLSGCDGVLGTRKTGDTPEQFTL